MEQRLWYVVQTYSGLENTVKNNLEKRIESMGMEDQIYRVIIPEETEVEIKNGKKKEKVRKIFPGYVFLEMKVTDESWYVVRNTPNVTGFIGSSGKGAKPVPLRPEEIDPILKRLGLHRAELDINIAVGDKVKIKEGPFAGQIGTVDEIDEDRMMLKVLVEFFGRQTTFEIDFNQIEEIE
jgi:transcription termination/antitermination protein NusG